MMRTSATTSSRTRAPISVALLALGMIGAPMGATEARAQDTAPALDAPPPGDLGEGGGEAEPDAPEDRATSFRNVRGAESEQIPGGALVVAAYGAIGILLLLFVARQSRLIASARQDLDDLKRRLDQRDERESQG